MKDSGWSSGFLPHYIFAVWLVLPVLCLAASAPYEGEVVRVIDGDTVVVLVDGQEQVKVRLAEIDTPERKQPWSNRARQALSSMTFRKTVTVHPVTVDRYKRIVAHLTVTGTSINREMVRTGNAWVYRKYMEDEARKIKRGLWGLLESKRIPPWEWRKHKFN